MKTKDSYLSRRNFLCSMIGGGATALGCAAAIPMVQYSGNFRKEPPPDYLELTKEEYELEPGKARMLMYGHIPALLVRAPEPESPIKAFVAICTHFDCTVSYREDTQQIFCACHEGYYDLDGNVVSGPPPRPLQKFYTTFRGENMIIALEKETYENAISTAKG